MKYVIAMMLVFASLGCGIWGGYAPGFSGYVPPAAYGTGGYSGGYGGRYFIPPPPPEGVAFVEGHGYPNVWRDSHLVRVPNNTGWYVRVRMDGVDLVFADFGTGLPLLPPHTEGQFYAPLDQTDLRSGCETHHFEFEAYLAPNFERPVVRSDREREFCVGWESQEVNIGSPF